MEAKIEQWYEVVRYAISRNENFIVPVKVSKSTNKSVWAESNFRKGKFQRSLRSSGWSSYFKTFDEAKTFALDRQMVKIKSTQDRLVRENADYAKIQRQVDPVLFDNE